MRILTALNTKTLNWFQKNLFTESWQWINQLTVAIDHHYIEDILQVLNDDGFIRNTDFEVV